MRLALDAKKHLDEMPVVARLWPMPLQRVAEQRAGAQAPLSDALERHHHVANGEGGLDIAQAQAEAVIQLDRLLDHLRWETEAAVEVG